MKGTSNLKFITLVLMSFFFSSILLFSQNQVDTLINGIHLKVISRYSSGPYQSIFYNGRLEIKGGKVISPQAPASLTYDSCYPCYLYEYRQDGSLWEEGVYLTDCPYGPTIRYFTNGKIAYTSNSIPDTSGLFCSVLHGEAVSYSRYGEKLLTEYWHYGNLIRILPTHVNASGDVNFLIGNRTLLINDTVSLDNLDGMHMQPDSLQNTELLNKIVLYFIVRQNGKHSTIMRHDNIQMFRGSELIDELRKKEFNLNQEMDMQILINQKEANEIIETHYLVFIH